MPRVRRAQTTNRLFEFHHIYMGLAVGQRIKKHKLVVLARADSTPFAHSNMPWAWGRSRRESRLPEITHLQQNQAFELFVASCARPYQPRATSRNRENTLLCRFDEQLAYYLQNYCMYTFTESSTYSPPRSGGTLSPSSFTAE